MAALEQSWARARGPIGRVGNQALKQLGLRISRVEPPQPGHLRDALAAQQSEAKAIIERHHRQSVDDVARLIAKYEKPVFGEVDTWELVTMLSRCVDPTDVSLGNASQLTHVEQVLDAMIDDGVTDEDVLIVAIVHDLGKLLLLTDEDPANVVCMNRFVEVDAGVDTTGCTVRDLTPQWNHDEFVHLRFGPLLRKDLAWLVRYHSFMPQDIEPFLDDQEREVYERLHRPFFRYDQGSKSPHLRPRTNISDFKDLVARRLPASITF